LVAIGGLAVGIHAVLEATQSRHVAMPAGSSLKVVVEPRSNRAERGQALEDVTAAQLASCDLEVAGRIQGPPEVVSEDPFRLAVVFAPALDPTDRKQFRGCVEDWVVDNHLIDVISMDLEGAR
jgi:hypothetical protein